MLLEWITQKIEALKDYDKIVIVDPHRIIQENDKTLKLITEKYGFIIISASTNLVLRELMFHAEIDEKEKILLIDQTPPLRKSSKLSKTRAPPLFYPDILAGISKDNIIDVNLQQFLIFKTNDTNWPKEANNRKYAKLIYKNLDAIITAHSNLRKVDPKRFSDEDFRKIIAFAALGIPISAFTQLFGKDLWRLVFVKREKIKELENIAPETISILKSEIKKAEKPFCWFADEDPDLIVKGFYISLLLAQHLDDWGILLANVDPSIKKFREVPKETLFKFAPEVIRIDPKLADLNISTIEASFSKDAIQTILLDKLDILNYEGYKSILQKESYSVLFRSLAMLIALRDLLNNKFSRHQYTEIHNIISEKRDRFTNERESESWSCLLKIYELSHKIQKIRHELKSYLKVLKIGAINDWTIGEFLEKWNNHEINRLEYYSSSLERSFDYSKDLFIPANTELPVEFKNAISEIGKRIAKIIEQTDSDLIELNNDFQDFVAKDYTKWVKESNEVTLTSQFVKRCLKPNWDPEKERAIILIFDGMRYDIWDQFLKPIIQDYMEIVQELPALSILPTETHITRKAISAGKFPDEFDTKWAENRLLEQALSSYYNSKSPIEPTEPDGSGTGQTVRYKGNNIEVYIFELCDTILHGISVKNRKGRDVPSQPLELIYEQMRNIFEKEVLAIIRRLPPGVKVFITADHGFRRIERKKIGFKSEDLNNDNDCNYLNCRLKVPLDKTQVPDYLGNKIIRFDPSTLRLPSVESWTDRTGRFMEKRFSEIIFPRADYSFERPNARYNPDAWSHGGISLQEMVIPMVALKVKDPETEILTINIDSNLDFNETEEKVIPIRLMIKGKKLLEDMRVDLEVSTNSPTERTFIGSKIVFLKPFQEQETSFTYKTGDEKILPEERSNEEMRRQLTVTARYYFGEKQHTKTETKNLVVKLNSERIVRRVGRLGNIIGLSPKRRDSYS